MWTESLESRRLMSVAASAALGTLYVYGDDYANGIRLLSSNRDIVVQKRITTSTWSEIYRVADNKITKVRIEARGGNDSIQVDTGIHANVTINGGNGADWLKAGGEGCVVFGDHTDLLSSAGDDNAVDTIVGGSSKDALLFGQGGDDKIYTGMLGYGIGSTGTDNIYGGNGNDRIYATFGSDTRRTNVHGESGNDRVYATAKRVVEFHGEGGRDTIDYSQSTAAVYVDLSGMKASGPRGLASDRATKIHYDVENAVGSKFDDAIDGNNSDNEMYGGDGNDSLDGGHGNDWLHGGNGNDSINGDAGNDHLYGDANSDFLIAASGRDVLYGGSGDDTMSTKDGDYDTVWGGTGVDKMFDKDSKDALHEVP